MKSYTLLLGHTILLLTACQSIEYDTPLDNPHVLLPEGSIVQLKQSLDFKPNNSRSTIQYGKPVGAGRASRFNSWCQFYLYESQADMKNPRTIEPDQFTVTKSFHNAEYGSLNNSTIGFDSSSKTMQTTMRLHSDRQPQVYELRCGIDDDPRLQNWVTINQMIETLGEVATVKLPQTFQATE